MDPAWAGEGVCAMGNKALCEVRLRRGNMCVGMGAQYPGVAPTGMFVLSREGECPFLPQQLTPNLVPFEDLTVVI